MLALGLLVGLVIVFVTLLSRLPVDSALADIRGTDVRSGLDDPSRGNGFEFYTVLAERRAADTVYPATLAPEPAPSRIIPPATRVVPGSAQAINGRALAAESYAEIPASSLGQESYFLQAGNFPEPVDAERARAAVLLLGLDAFIVTRQDSTGAIGHRVRIGPFFDQGRLTEVKKRLRAARIGYEIIRVTG